MKKFLALFVLVFVFLPGGVAFGYEFGDGLGGELDDGPCLIPGQVRSGDLGLCSCPDGTFVDVAGGAGCVPISACEAGPNDECGIETATLTDCANKGPDFFYDTVTLTCYEGTPYCVNKFDADYKWDPNTFLCYNYKTGENATILPTTEFSYTACSELYKVSDYKPNVLKDIVKSGDAVPVALRVKVKVGGEENISPTVSPLDVLACGIKTGNISLWMIPFYVKYLIQFLMGISGLLAIFSIIIGGYFYMFGGIGDDKDKGKRAIIYGLAGFVLALTSWALVNTVISLLTR